MEIKNLNVRELNQQEMIDINGGSAVGDFFRTVWNGISNAAEWIWERISDWIFEAAKDSLSEKDRQQYDLWMPF
ncbi:MAG: hypothetical protein ABSA76_15460 [Bacteroidales bacterium]